MKKQNIAIISTAVAAGLGLGTTEAAAAPAMAADQVAETGITQQVAAPQQVTEKTVAAKQEAVAEAEKKATESQKTTAEAQAAVDQTQADLTDAQENYDQKQAIAEDATPENIAGVEMDIARQKDANAEQAEAAATAEEAVKAAEAATEKPKAELEAAQQESAKADEAVAEKQAAVDAAQADLDGSSKAAAEEKLNQANQQLNQAKKDLSTAETAATTAESAVKPAQDNETKAATAAKEASENALQAQKKAEGTAAIAKNTSDQLEKLKSQMGADNSIPVTQEYVDALKAFNKSKGTAGYDAARERLLQATKENLAMVPNFQSTEADKAVRIGTRDDITQEILTDISTFAASILNPIRGAFGDTAAGPVIVTDGSVKFAADIARNYVADDWNIFEKNDHDKDAINKAAKDSGLQVTPGMNMYENIYGSEAFKFPNTDLDMSLDSLKELVRDSLVLFLFNVNEWDHANGITGQMFSGSSFKNNDFYFGVSFSDLVRSEGKLDYQIMMMHFETIPTRYIQDPTKFDTTTVHELPVNDPAEIAKLAATLATQQKAAEEAKAAAEAAQVKNNQAATALQEAQAQLAAATAAQVQTAADLEQAKTNLQQANAAQAAAQQAVVNAEATAETKLAALEKAQAELTEAKAAQETTASVLAEKQAAYTAAAEALQQAVANAATAKEELAQGESDLQEKEAYLQKLLQADENLAAATVDLVNAQKNYDDALANLQKANQQAATDQATYEKLKSDLIAAQTQLAKEQERAALETAVNKAAQQTKLVAAPTKKNADVKLANTVPTTAAKVSAAVYPKTGAADDRQLTLLGMALMSMLGTLGLVKIGKHDGRFKRER